MEIKPILFSTEMVQAILEGRKKMTRRTKGIPNFKHDDYTCFDVRNGWFWFYSYKCSFDRIKLKAPYYIGDILWVRESFFIYSDNVFLYKADLIRYLTKGWRPSIHMPKEACRIFLKVTDVRCERLHEITEQDAIDEGILYYGKGVGAKTQFKNYYDTGGWFQNPIMSFESLWAKINGQASWDANPYVWVISFERCDRPDNFLITK